MKPVKSITVSMGMHLRKAPFGGGNQFGNALVNYLEKKGITVRFDLKTPNLDLLLLIQPRTSSQSSTFTDRLIWAYLRKHPQTLVIHRVNECDERKATCGVNWRLRMANRCADHTVFVSDWLRKLHQSQGMTIRKSTVILNGADRRVFHPQGYQPWQSGEPLRLVTHHWSDNWLKGFDVYQQIDEQLGNADFRRKFHFTYIGNLPEGFRFKHANYGPPLYGQALANALRQHHVYITASRYEPGSHHQNEGASCGLPLLYINSGSLPEYCKGFGIQFSPTTLTQALDQMRTEYPKWANTMSDYPHDAQKTSHAYYQLIMDMITQRDTILAQRDPLQKWRWRQEAILNFPVYSQAVLRTRGKWKIKRIIRKWRGQEPF